MRVLLASNASYLPPRGGSTRSNLLWLEHIAAQAHQCRVVAAAAAKDTVKQKAQVQAELEQQRLQAGALSGQGVERGLRNGIEIFSVAEPARRPVVLREQIREFQPDWVLVSSEDLGHVLLREAHHCAPGRVVYLAHTPQFFPFGPASWNPDPHATELVARSAAVVPIGHHTAEYIKHYSGANPTVVHPPIYGEGPFASFGTFDQGLVTMINPCAVKGISIFLEMAHRLPEIAFGALPGWGTTSADREALTALPNVTILPHAPHIEQVLAQTRVLLMPSLWYEGFGLIVMEAMLRGIPVISSDSGGLVEAKMGTRFVLPVQPIERYEAVFDEHSMPRPVLPPQRIEPWSEALLGLLGDRTLYQEESEASRTAALKFVSGLRAAQLEEMLLSLPQAGREAMEAAAQVDKQEAAERLSPEKRALLLQRLRRSRQ